jgi:hypothetical protein
MTKSPDYGVKGLRNSTDDTTGHTFGQDLILIAGTDLFSRLFASQMALPGLAKFNFPSTGYFKSFGYSFVRLLHFMEKSGYLTFLSKGKQAKYALGVVNQQTLIALIGKPHCKDQKQNPGDQFNQ